MNTLNALLRIWSNMLLANPYKDWDGQPMITAKLYPEGPVYFAHHKAVVGQAFSGETRFLESHAEYDLKIHFLKAIIARIDCARKTLNLKTSPQELILDAKWVLIVAEQNELLLDTLEVELSREFTIRYAHIA